MFASPQKRARALAVLFALALAAPPSVALAQTAPVIGDHYAARASDTGFAGAVNSTGGYSASVPLDMPGARGGLPVPVHVVHGGNAFGAAGMGWDVPLSFIRVIQDVSGGVNQNIAHRRPISTGDSDLQGRTQYSLTLDGTAIDLVQTTDILTWQARRGNEQLKVRLILSSGTFEMYDGNGLRYVFSNANGADPFHPLADGNLYLLQDIFGSGGTHVHLTYDFGQPSFSGSITIDLVGVSYNFDSSGTCAKHQINLAYESDDPHAPLSVSLLGKTPWLRNHKLHTIDVTAREAAADQPQPCSGAMRSLRTYSFAYQNDADTGRWQLNRVTMIGREGTPERNVTLPVATYNYAQVKESDGTLHYSSTQAIGLPSDFNDSTDGILGVAATQSLPDNGLASTFTLKGLYDVNGDGRPDVVYSHSAGSAVDFTNSGGRLWLNEPTSDGGTAFSDVGYLNPNHFPFMKGTEVSHAGTTQVNVGITNAISGLGWTQNIVVTQLIDMNGDGRLDIVNSEQDPDNWNVYLNTADPNNPNNTIWQLQKISTAPIRQHLIEAGLWPQTTPPLKFLPLSRSFSQKTIHLNNCWKFTGSGYVESHGVEGYSNTPGSQCRFPQGDDASQPNYGLFEDEGETTIVEWKLQDINGDGYPDFVYNGSPVTAQLQQFPPPPGSNNSPFLGNSALFHPVFAGPNPDSTDVRALINVAGVHLDTSTQVGPVHAGDPPLPATNTFSKPVILEASGGCGALEKWLPGFGPLGRSTQICGFADVNGDGLVDRINSIPSSSGLTVQANLGTGDINEPFSGAIFPVLLPGPIGVQQRQIVQVTDNTGTRYTAPPDICTSDTATYPQQSLAALRDINGDGIPDYIVGVNLNPSVPSNSTNWFVYFGTGTGFTASPVPMTTSSGFQLSMETVNCKGLAATAGATAATAATTAGLFDLDGDGLPESVQLIGNSTLAVQKLSRPPVSGRLFSISDGYGTFTNVAYGSAKKTGNATFLPYPEVVVTEIHKQDAGGVDLVSPLRYAYGGASQYFDAGSDRWVFPGYQRKITLQTTGDPNAPNASKVTITDSYPVASFDPNSDPTTRFLRYLKAGRTSDVTTLAGDFGTSDPSAFLLDDVTRDGGRIAASHMDYSARVLGQGFGPLGPLGAPLCVDMVYPYSYDQSLAYSNDPTHVSFDQCLEYGFALQTTVTSYRGTPGNAVGTADVIVSPQIVKTGLAVTAFDDFGRVTDSIDRGDLADDNSVPNDNLCVHIDYAAPQTTPMRVLNAVAQQTVQDCNNVTLAKKRFEYDGLTADKAGQVTNGFVTSSTVTRYDEDAHSPLGDIRLFDAAYDSSGNGTLRGTIRFRDDGAVSQVQYNYDAFGLVVTSTVSTATDPIEGGLPAISSSSAFDPVTLNRTSTTDANGTVTGTTYDGFGRVTRSKVTPPGGTEGVLSSTSYTGFELVDTNGDGIPDSPDPTLGGRSIALKVFQDAVPEANVATAPGRIQTMFFDSFGRVNTTKADLGANYPNKVATFRSYDALGRLNFTSDPYEDNGTEQTLYGTSYNYNPDGTPSCFVRGPGLQPVTRVSDETNEIYPTCFNRSFANNQEILTRNGADSLARSGGQVNVVDRKIRNAKGQVLETNKTQPFVFVGGGGVNVFEDAAFGYDVLGRRTSMKRYKDPVAKTGAVTTQWHYDSLGWMTKLQEGGVADQTRTFDSWGNVTTVQWCDDLTPAPCPTADRRSITRYDARNRPIHREDQSNSSGQPIQGTAVDFSYDANSAFVGFASNNVLGRLASATWSTGQEWFTYDAFGRVNSRAFIDTSVASNDHHYEIHEFHDDGSEKTLHLALQDTNKQDEQVNYGYDSAGRVNSVVYSFGGTSQTLFSASGTSPIYDAFGRIKAAKYGATSFSQSFAATGRRLLTDRKVTGDYARDISFPTTNGVNPYDPVGRERSRKETIAMPGGLIIQTLTFNNTYDALGRLTNQGSTGTQVSTPVGSSSLFTYDPLGNLLTETGTPTAGLSYGPTDLDRLCDVVYGTTQATSSCNVGYDGAGDTVSMPTRTGTTRALSYFPNGAVSQITDGGSIANFTYDAFGVLQQLAVSTTSADRRADKYFGAFIKQRIEGSQSVINRRIPVPGLSATRHGPTGGWTFAFADGRGTRFVTNEQGSYQQGVDYQPFGLARSPSFFPMKPSVGPGTTNYENEQFNGGDLLAAFGLVNLGARVYDPVIGRFLSRDSMIGDNAYAFAFNDPVNNSDTTGRWPDETPGPANPPLPDAVCPGRQDCGNDREYEPGSLDGEGVREATTADLSFGRLSGGDPAISRSATVGGPSCQVGCTTLPDGSVYPNPGTPGAATYHGPQWLPRQPGDPEYAGRLGPSGMAYSSPSFVCVAATRSCFTSMPTPEDYASHWRDGTGWPVYRLGSEVNLGDYGNPTWNQWPGTKVRLSPGSANLAGDFLGWEMSRTGIPLTAAGTDAFIYGHINDSVVLGRHSIQLAKDTFTLKKEWGKDEGLSGWARDKETWLQWKTLGKGSAGMDFETIFVGPTPVQ